MSSQEVREVSRESRLPDDTETHNLHNAGQHRFKFGYEGRLQLLHFCSNFEGGETGKEGGRKGGRGVERREEVKKGGRGLERRKEVTKGGREGRRNGGREGEREADK